VRRLHFFRVAAIAGVLVSLPVPGLAHHRDAVRTQARTSAQQWRAQGEPKDRCSIGATLYEGGVVVELDGSGPLNEGDRLSSLNGTDVSSMATEQIIGILRTIAADAVIPLVVQRGSEQISLQIQCSNARARSETLLNVLDQAGRGRFDDCVRLLAGRNDLGFFGANMALQCASVSRSPERHNLGELAFQAGQRAIRIARWVPANRQPVLQLLRALEGAISRSRGAAGFQELVQLTRQWPGDEGAWQRSEPDWVLFRRNAEIALRSRLVDPDSARIEWPFGFTLGNWKPLLASRIEGYWTCGQINARNRMGGYTGATSFVVVLSPEGQVRYSEVGTSQNVDILSSQCARSISLLPTAPPALRASSTPQQNAPPAPSLADELERLVRLRDSGAITPAEFDAAKGRLLAQPNP